jgi:hypothetical protein
VLLDVVHSHISSNADDGLAGFDLGQPEEANYFKQVGGCGCGWHAAAVSGSSGGAVWRLSRGWLAAVCPAGV